MPIDFTTTELKLLLRQFQTGHVVLFAGAGFSVGALSGVGKEPPTGVKLAEVLASECGVAYSGEDLAVVFDFAQKRLGTERLSSILFSLYRDCQPSPGHLVVPRLLWGRIYTTNIDDVIQRAYALGTPSQKLRTIICPAPHEDRDPWFGGIQCIHLHGSVLDLTKGITFTPSELADQTAKPNPWYQALVDDLYAQSTLFIGTRLNDPPFYHYLELRAPRARGRRDFRGTAYLVSPGLTPIRRRHYEDHGIHPIDATADEFLLELVRHVEPLVPSRIDLLKNRYPHDIEAITSGTVEKHAVLLQEFEYVRPRSAPSRRTARDTFFFDGAEPTWDDIASDVDAPRSMTAPLLSSLTSHTGGVRVTLLTGHAGTGKSSVMRRLAFEIARQGKAVYYLKSAHRFTSAPVIELLSGTLRQRVYVFVDDAHVHLEPMGVVLGAIDRKTEVTFVLAERPHAIVNRIEGGFAVDLEHVEMPNLERNDARQIIERLESFGLLGVLQGKSREHQIREFVGRSRKQLLVAMKEATSGKGFDIILTNEYATLASNDARLAYVVCCLAYMHGAPVARRHLLAVMDGSDVDRARVLSDELRGVCIPWRERADWLAPRHRVIARHVAVETAPFDEKQAAVVRFLTQVAADLTPETIRRRIAEYVAYRGIINLDNMLELFGEDYETIGETYSELDAVFSHDFLFKLEFGRAELHFDNFERAENYLNQSLSIRPKDRNVKAWHQMGVLNLKRARFEDSPPRSAEYARLGEAILREQVEAIGAHDSYPCAALVLHKLRYLKEKRPSGMIDQIKELYHIAGTGISRHPLAPVMKEAHAEVTRAYLLLAVK